MTTSIRFPLFHQPEISVEFFPDELPEDHYDLIDGLRLELAPLKVWKQCALEYYRQGSMKAFEDILGDIVNELKNPEVAAAYRAKEDYVVGISDIYIVLAAKEIVELAKKKVGLASNEEISAAAKRCIESLKLVEAEKLLNEYVWVLKGYFELLHDQIDFCGLILLGSVKRSEELFRMTLDRVTRVQAAKKKFLFPTLIGLGMAAFSVNNFQQALDYFLRAVTTHPGCDASVRTAIAVCSFKLQQYDRARLALQRANHIDPSNANQLILQALLELADAKKDRTNRAKLRQYAYEYLFMANKMDENNPSALVHLANHAFHSWHIIQLEPKGFLLGSETLLVPVEGYTEVFEMGNQIKLKLEDFNDSTHLILNRKEVSKEDLSSLYPQQDLSAVGETGRYYEIQFSPAIKSSPSSPDVIPLGQLEVKNLKAVADFVDKALALTNLSAVKAECYYILGKVHHLHKNLTLAFDFYGKALSCSGDLAPAAFGAAQIYFARQDYTNALKLFNDLLQANPDDKDTLAYVKLLKGLLHDEIAPIEKLREVAPGFQFEIDLWLSQAQLRHKRVGATTTDLTEALKCYLYAKEAHEAQQRPLPPNVLGNISTLYYMIGNYDRALDYLRLTFRGFHQESSSGAGVSSHSDSGEEIYSCSDLEGFYFDWKEKPELRLQQDVHNLNRFSVFALPSPPPSSSANEEEMETVTAAAPGIKLAEHFQIGEEISIENMLWTIESFPSDSEMICKSSYGQPYHYQPFQRLRDMRKQFEEQKNENKNFQMPSTSEMMEILTAENVPILLSVRQKVKWNTFTDQTVSYSFNLARVLEDMGNVQPASLLYRTILKTYPAHIDCYVRLSRIYRALGKYPLAIESLLKARSLAPDSTDLKVTLGELYSSAGQLEEARKLLDDAYTTNRKDPQAMLAMGNYWYHIYSLKRTDEGQLRTSYKFYHPVLTDHVRNAFAANGLGVVCATKGETEAAREIFSKIRQANLKHCEDTEINLANVYMTEKRYMEAERLYFSVLKTLPTNPLFVHYHYSHLLSLIGVAQYSSMKFEESFKTMLKAWHMTPMEALVLFNFSIISNQIANMCIDRLQKTSSEIEIIMNIVKVSIKILHYLSKSKKLIGQFEQKDFAAKESTAKERLRVLTEQYSVYHQREEEERAQRRKIDEEHQLRKQQRLEQEQQRAEAEISRRQENIDRILQKEKRLEELRSQWIVMNAAAASRGKGNDDDFLAEGGGEEAGEGGAKTKKRKRNPNNNTLEPSEKPKRKERLKRAKKSKIATVDSDEDEEGGGGRRTQPMDSDDDEEGDDNSTSWLDDLDKPIAGSESLLASTKLGGQLDSDDDDDIFGDKDEEAPAAKAKMEEEEKESPVKKSKEDSKVETPADDDEDDFNFD